MPGPLSKCWRVFSAVSLSGFFLCQASLAQENPLPAATDAGQVAKAMQSYERLYLGYPDRWDALTDGKALVNYLPGGVLDPQKPRPLAQVNGLLTAGPISDDERQALHNAGITRVYLMVPNPQVKLVERTFDPTLVNYANAANISTPVGNEGTMLAFIDPKLNKQALTACKLLKLSETGRYVVLGIGPRSSMIGKVLSTAPIHVVEGQPSMQADAGYQRYCAIFKISDSAAAPMNRAVFVGVTPLWHTGIVDIVK